MRRCSPGGPSDVVSILAQLARTTRVRAIAPICFVALLLAACGGGDKQGSQVQWIEGTPPPEFIAQIAAGHPAAPTVTPTQATTDGAPDAEPTPTAAPQQPEPTATSAAPPPALITDVKLTSEQLQEFRPNELGQIPVLEYHVITTDPDQEAQYARTVDDFKGDLQWLYDHGFYVVPLKDVIQNSIKAPAGKKPVVLTFDDSTAGQFRYLITEDGSVTIDPDSAVGVMEAFYAEHPDFGRGGFFAVLPSQTSCFSWQFDVSERDQIDYCQQKLTWLIDNGYEVGNHTRNHTDLFKVDDDTFRDEISGAISALQEYDPRIEANILAMPFGNYPDAETREEQRTWLKDGFSWDGQDYFIIGCLMVGANPAYSPNSTEWDSMWIPRIQAFDKDANVDDDGLDTWFSVFESDPDQLYTSDGDPNIVTVPESLPVSLEDELDTDRIESEGKDLVRY
jgi:peptidoglycan/xylan/chitin deacetylase (PgdA/CDA1 family)